MELKGKFVAFLGDSITEGAGVADIANNRYDNVLKNIAGLSRTYNDGIGGSRIAYQRVPSDCARYDLCYCGRAHNLPADADVIVVFGGTNDYGHGEAPLGVPSDRDPSTFWGACHYLMNGLLTRYVGKPVVILTPLHRDNEDNPCGDNKPRSIAPLSVYRDILMEVAAYYGLPVLDLYATSGIQPANAVCRERLLPDGLHPSDEGHALIAHRIGKFLEML